MATYVSIYLNLKISALFVGETHYKLEDLPWITVLKGPLFASLAGFIHLVNTEVGILVCYFY